MSEAVSHRNDALKTMRRARNDFAFAAVMFTATAGSALWIANSMDEGERFDLHSRLPQTAEMIDFANFGEKLLLVPCAGFPLLSYLILRRREKTYQEAKKNVPQGLTPS